MTRTVTIRPDSALDPGERYYVSFTEYPAGPADKKGYLAKYGPFDGVVFDSYTDVRLDAAADGMEVPVPGDSARTLDSNSVGNYVSVTNPAGSGVTVQESEIEVILFQSPSRATEEGQVNRLQFSGRAVISDLVPGVTTDG